MAMIFIHRLGKKGERLACRYLKKQGYVILKRNYKCRYGEVDIIAQKGDLMAFVEVKTRSSTDFADPADAVTNERKRRYHNVADMMFSRCSTMPIIRFDIIEVVDGLINHLEDAF